MGNPRFQPAGAVFLFFFLFAAAAFSADGPAPDAGLAEETGTDAELISNLTEACRRAADTFSAELAVQSADNLKTHARMETKNLLYLLNRYPEKEKAAGWIEFLRLEDLKRTLSQQETDMSVVASALERFGRDEEGLELPDFARVRNLLSDYAAAVERAGGNTIHDDFTYTCNMLPGDVQRYIDDPASVEAPGRIAAALDFMNECQQNSNSVRDITNLLQARFSQPNVQAWIGKRVLFSDQPIAVSEPFTVREIVRGNPTYGNGTMKGALMPSFNANEKMAEILLVFKADIITNSMAVSSMGVSVNSNSYAKVTVEKPIYFDGKEITLGTSRPGVNMNISITGINSGRGMIGSKVVEDRVAQEYPYAKAESIQLLKDRMRTEFDERVEPLTDANARLAKVWDLLKKYDYMPEINTRTTANMLEFSAKIGSSRQVTAGRLPSRELGPHDLVVRVHQSAVNNPLHELFAGRRLSEKEVKAWIRENIPEANIDRFADEAAERMRSRAGENGGEDGLDTENFSISFCEELPACVTFTGDVLGVHLRVDEFAQKEKVFPGLDIDVEYALERKDGQWRLALKDYEAWPPEVDRGAVVPARYQVIRRQIKNRLSAMLPEEIPLAAIPVFDFDTGPRPASEKNAEKAGKETADGLDDEIDDEIDGCGKKNTEKASAREQKVRGRLNAGELSLTEGWFVMGADYEPVN